MGKILRILVLGVILVFAISLFGCGEGQKSKPQNNIPPKTSQKPSGNAKTKDPKAPDYKYIITSMPISTKIEMNTPWKASPNGELKATIEGKGLKAEEEGYSHIVIRDDKSNKLLKFTLADEEKKELAAKDIEWIDDNNMFVIIGEAFGTISKGGKIYKLNLSNGEVTLFMDTKSSKEEFTSLIRSKEGFQYKMHIYDDNNYIKGHSEIGIIKP